VITVERRRVRRTGTCSIGLFLGRGYAQERRVFTTRPWCVIENGTVLAECRSQAAAERIRAALITAEPSTLQAKIRHAMQQPSIQL
jgi:hypothetical protein